MSLPISAIIPTANRPERLARTLRSVAASGETPRQIIIVDASPARETAQMIVGLTDKGALPFKIVHAKAIKRGAAQQRNQGIAIATEPYILFLDDDVDIQPGCIQRMLAALQNDESLGGVNATITNQRYVPPGTASRLLFRLLAGKSTESYAGRVIGPGVNLLPEDRDDLPEVVPVQWLNSTCTIYRREALPHPVFPDFFEGYSLCEDLTLSLTVGRSWKLANARTARIHHDSQPGEHKNDARELARMEIVNRHFVMTQILHRRKLRHFAGLLLWELFNSAAIVCQSPRKPAALAEQWRGKWRGIRQIAGKGHP